MTRPDFLVVGGGIVGLGTAMALAESGCGRVVVMMRRHWGERWRCTKRLGHEAPALGLALAMHETVGS
ncbi:MAG: FAD-dependent oxidoreductase [Planctomycetota bacterium]